MTDDEVRTDGGVPAGAAAPGATFSYTFSAERREEVERIREKYLPRDADPAERLRELDRGVTRKGAAVALTVGIVGALLLGMGMCMTMVWTGGMFVPGVAVGLAGIALVALAYPLYRRVVRRERERVAPEVLRISEELLR